MTDTADSETRREDRIPVDLNQPIELSVHNPNGDVTVRATERTDVLIGHVTPDSSRGRGDEEIELAIDARQNRIEVHVSSPAGTGWAGIAGDVDLDAVFGQITRAFRRGGSWSSAQPGKVRLAGRHAWCDITIEVPQAMTGRVEIHSTSGDVRVDGVTSEIALNTISGDVRVVRTSGDLALQTASGDLIVEGAAGRLTAQTASGDVRITSAQMDGFDVRTASGDLLLDAMLTGEGTSRAQTASGDVRLTLRGSTAGADEPAATLAFHTVSGDAHVAQPFRKIDRRLWQAGSGDRGPRIDITTVSGDLTAGIAAMESAFGPASTPTLSTHDVPPAPPAPPAPPTPPAPVIASNQPWSPTEPAQSTFQEEAARLAVLEAVERGELDVEEALRRLEAADSSLNT